MCLNRTDTATAYQILQDGMFSQKQAQSSLQSGQHMKILVAEDDPAIRDILAAVLARWGYEVVTAYDGNEAWLALQEDNSPCLAILSRMLPGMTGTEICRRLREIGLATLPYVIFLTAMGSEEDVVLGFNAGANDYIIKPFDYRELRARLRIGEHVLTLQTELQERVEELLSQRRELHKAKRALKVLSLSNQVLIRAEEELEFLDKICGIIVEEGGYRLAWIGYHGTDKENDLNPVAQAGYCLALEQSELFGAKETVLTDKFSIIRNIPKDSNCVPRCAENVGRGCPSAVTLPLISRGEHFGALHICTAEPDAFDAKEEELLTELADDLAYGIQSLRAAAISRAAEEALRKSEEKYRRLFEETRDTVFISTPGGKFLDVNPAGLELFGFSSREELLACDIPQDIYSDPAERESFKLIMAEQGFVKDFEVRLKRKGDESLTIQLTATAVLDEAGMIKAYRGILRDVTRQKRLEEKLLQAQKMEAVGQLAGGIAHDFNNVLTAITGYGYLLLTREGLTGQAAHFTEQILAAAERAAGLTRGLLAFSRKQTIKPRPTDANEILVNVEKLLRRLIGEDIELKVELADKTLPIMADSGQLEQVFMNLATNARDAMPEGGLLAIKTEFLAIDSEFMHTHGYGSPGSHACISFSDSGEGMNEETRKKIFEPFFTTKETGKGTGLGLAIVYGIINQHRGYINVYSEQGKGTTFRIYLPMIAAETPAGEILEDVIPVGGTETILVAEDDDAARRIMKKLLEDFGYTVIEAVDGDDGVRKFHENEESIGLLILDILMPKRNGREAYDAITKVRSGTKALFTSGYPAEILRNKGIFEEEMDFVTKPVVPGEFLQRVRKALDKP